MVAGEVRAAVSGVGVDGVSLQEVLRPEGLPTRTCEPVNLEHLLTVTSLCLLACLLLPHAAADLHVEDKRDGTRELKCVSVVALDVLVAHIILRVVEDTVSPLALRVPVWRRFLHVDPVPAVHIVRQHALLVVWNLVVKQETLGAELDGG